MKRLIGLLLAAALCLCGCMTDDAARPDRVSLVKPAIPEKLAAGKDGVPVLTVYDTSTKKLEEMDLEDYVAGVVAGEMKNDWPLEALKAQAILARTFVLKFCQDKDSRYEGADISTDVAEAQAYAPQDVNHRVLQAVEMTRGQVMSVNGEYPYVWFHAHAGGMTERPSVALDFKGEDPDYLTPTVSEESDKAPEDVKRWTAAFTKDQVAQACHESGLELDAVERVEVGEKGESGRAKTLLINGQPVSAPSFRIHIGANRLKSALIEDIRVEGDRVTFTGRGFGHGVGLSQWGAYAMAEKGNSAREIIRHYFPGVQLVGLWK